MATGYIFSTNSDGKLQSQYVVNDVPTRTDIIPAGCWVQNPTDTHIEIRQGGAIIMDFAASKVLSVGGVDPEADINDLVIQLGRLFPEVSTGGTLNNADTLQPLSNLTATAGDAQIVASFTAAPSPADGHYFQASPNSDFSAPVVTGSSATSPATITGLTNGTPYHVRGRATKTGYFPSVWIMLAANGTVLPVAAGTVYNMIAEGDSQTAGVAPYFVSFFTQLAADYSGNAAYEGWYNNATPGDTTAGINGSSEFADVVAEIDSAAAKNICFIYIGINDGRVASTPSDAYARLITWCTNAHNAGLTLIPILLPSIRETTGTVSQADMMTYRAAYNNLVRAGYNTDLFATVLVDTESDPYIGGSTSADDDIWFLTDKLHLSTWGQARLKNLAQVALQNVIANTPGVVAYVTPSTTLNTLHKADGDNTFFTFFGDFPGTSATGLSSFRDSDLRYFDPHTQDSGATFNLPAMTGEPEEGVNLFIHITDASTQKVEYQVNGGAWQDLNPQVSYTLKYPYNYPIRNLPAGVNTISWRAALISPATSSGQVIFDGADIFYRS